MSQHPYLTACRGSGNGRAAPRLQLLLGHVDSSFLAVNQRCAMDAIQAAEDGLGAEL